MDERNLCLGQKKHKRKDESDTHVSFAFMSNILWVFVFTAWENVRRW